ncbi:site-specific integrase, partial [Pseudomonas nitroreducens]
YVRQAYGILMGAMRQAHRLELILSNPMGSMRFTDFVRGKIPPKPAGLRPDGTAQLLGQLADHYGKAPAEALVALLMLCHGTRLGETRSARWRDFWLEEGLWTIQAKDTKTRSEHQLPLTRQVLALLRAHREYQQRRGIDSVFLFPGARGKPISASQATALFKAISGGEWSSHDLRKLARTSWTELGVDHLIGEMLLNHVMNGVAAAYIQTQARERKQAALQLWHDHLDTLGFQRIHGETEPGRCDNDNPAKASSAAAASAF